LAAFGVGLASALAGFYHGDRAALASSAAVPLEQFMAEKLDEDSIVKLKQLQNVVDEMAIWLLALVLAPLVCQMLAMLVSRQREYLADASGAELTSNPLALATALQKIEFAAAPTQAIKRGMASLCIADPLGRAAGLRRASSRTFTLPTHRWSNGFSR
jgi:Zn-dependent protease with chaperone function